MSAFASALAAIHADSNIGTPADFRRPPGPWVPARVVLSRPSDIVGGLGGLAARTGSPAATQLDNRVRTVEDVQPDPLGLSWRLILAET